MAKRNSIKPREGVVIRRIVIDFVGQDPDEVVITPINVSSQQIYLASILLSDIVLRTLKFTTQVIPKHQKVPAKYRFTKETKT